jgi:general secretion pathway protein A
MYEEYFGLTKKPFSIVPDPRYFYMSTGHREALAHLTYGIKDGGGFVLLTGEVGTGKTTVCRRLFEMLPETTEIAFILNPKMSVEELLATICDEFGIRYPEGNMSVKVFVALINDYLFDIHSKGRRAVLVIEEAQNLKPDVLEQIRLLTNLETKDHKLLQIVMLGQPELRTLLRKPEFLQLSQRITSRYHLGPLTRGEVPAYVNYRLTVAGLVRGELFPPRILKKLFRLSGGVPRLINVICDRALLGTFVQGKDKVDIKTLTTAAYEISGENNRGKTKKRLYYLIFTGISLVLLVTILMLFISQKIRYLPSSPEPATEKPAVKSDKIVKGTTLERPANLTRDNIKEMAFQALFNQWDIRYKEGNICDEAQKQGLRCQNGTGSIGSLRRMNRPAVLKLIDEKQGEYYAALTSLKGDSAVLSLGNETRIADIKEIVRWWTGDYLLLWRSPLEYKGKLKPGDRGPMVQWLVKKLAAVNGRAVPLEPQQIYSSDIVKEVKKLQLIAGLVPDGIVGFGTIMYLNAATENGEPLLNKAKGNE